MKGAITIPAVQAQETQNTFSFDIGARPQRRSLNEIGRVTGLSFVFDETPAASASAVQ